MRFRYTNLPWVGGFQPDGFPLFPEMLQSWARTTKKQCLFLWFITHWSPCHISPKTTAKDREGSHHSRWCRDNIQTQARCRCEWPRWDRWSGPPKPKPAETQSSTELSSLCVHRDLIEGGKTRKYKNLKNLKIHILK